MSTELNKSAFPFRITATDEDFGYGLSKLEYAMIHAPSEIPEWFQPLKPLQSFQDTIKQDIKDREKEI